MLWCWHVAPPSKLAIAWSSSRILSRIDRYQHVWNVATANGPRRRGGVTKVFCARLDVSTATGASPGGPATIDITAKAAALRGVPVPLRPF